MQAKYISLIVLLAATFSMTVRAELSDNSFLLEEAYNQDPGVVQFINYYEFTKIDKENDSSAYYFTNELPLGSRTHQISYTVPYMMSKEEGQRHDGVGDINLNYRYQLVDNDLLAVTPRLSLVLPTGKTAYGFGGGGTGVQAALALSAELSPRWVSHWNVGFTLTPSAKGPDGDKTIATVGSVFGASMVFRHTENLHWMLEMVEYTNEVAVGDGTRTREASTYISPGVRYAFDAGETQIVPGVGFPIGIGAADAESYSVILYLSLESKLW